MAGGQGAGALKPTPRDADGSDAEIQFVKSDTHNRNARVVKDGGRASGCRGRGGRRPELTLQWMTTTCWGSLSSQDSCALQMAQILSSGGACSSGQPTSRICNERARRPCPCPAPGPRRPWPDAASTDRRVSLEGQHQATHPGSSSHGQERKSQRIKLPRETSVPGLNCSSGLDGQCYKGLRSR